MSELDILVVDDNLDARSLVRDILEASDYSVREAPNGHEALRMIAEARPHLIILDLMMPEMDGFTMLTRLHNKTNDTIPVILLSAVADEAVMKRFPGVKAVLCKGSFTLAQFREQVSGALQSTPLTAE